MNYTVDWDPDAEIELARIWLQAPDPGAVTRAQAEIDRLLGRNPDGHGQHLAEGLWRIDVSPLAATYTIDAVRRQVQVTGVRFVP
jgi:hypothetical protein